MRDTGYYWLKIENNGGFEIGYFRNGRWLLSGLPYEYTDDAFQEIDERRIVRDKPCKDNQFKCAKLHVWDKDGNHIGTINCDPD